MDDLNSVCLVGRLAKDPELRTVGGSYTVCNLRLAFNTSQKVDGGWEDKSNFVDVKVWGGQGEAVAKHTSKGVRVAVKGRLEIREWEAEGGGRRYATEIIADRVQFIEPKSDSSSSTSTRSTSRQSAPPPADDDIPF